jgi:hypothetical protein
MKIRLNNKSRIQGSALLITVIIGAVLGFTMASYLVLVSSQNRSVVRSMVWNSAIPVLEAGVDEAFTHLYFNASPNLGYNGWVADGGYYVKTVTIGDSSCHVAIQPVEPPVIIATATLPAPLGQGQVHRRIKVHTERSYLFAKAMVADQEIDLRGNNIATDSYDSQGGTVEYDPSNARGNGDVATNSSLIGALDIGNADIAGKVSTGPDGQVDIGPNGAVGSHAFVSGGSTGIESSEYVNDDMNMELPSVQLPAGFSPRLAGSGSVGGTNYTYVLDSGDYQLSSFSGAVRVTGTAVLHVTDSVAFSGKNFIYIDPGASLKLYVSAASASIAGQGLLNQNTDVLSFQYYGMPGNTSLSLSGNASFTGIIYAPSAALTMGGGGKDVIDFVGSSVSRTVTMNGHFKFHYDESLQWRGPAQGYIPVSWDELDWQKSLASLLSELEVLDVVNDVLDPI